ncbi:SIR2 family protein [Clostridium sp.]|uniref:SIR2 family protein n=1 Tax=Clostridium sp. TaxID=1506 RepID=UPI002842AF97|nr:SIR2 family protein [Clostridium sp.]MDR3594239.1 SIR2 family protein [Clostridium sp.]
MRDYINTSIEKIRQAMDNNKLVIFVGAGVSANSKCPSWSELIEKFADELGIQQSERNNSTEYFLKIPQYYYIERGEKEYFDIINDVFDNPNNIPVPNAINKILFELNPSVVVTTNFDELLEKTILSEGRFYTVIKQDKDLPYSLNDNLVIKMHGDVKLKNIVLKEEDYLNYSNKFPLIENYLKGLFSTKTILFVGYSANDPDFKLIFNWVKEQLKGHFQPAYLLETEKEQERLEFNYYKDRGINILFYKEIENDIKKLFGDSFEKSLIDKRGQHLHKFLRYIKEYRVESNFVDDIFNKLKIFEGLNAIMPEDIINQLKKEYKCFNIKYNVLYINKEKCNYLNVLQEKIKEYLNKNDGISSEQALMEIIKQNKKIIEIFKILQKASIKAIQVSECTYTKEILLEDYIKLDKDEYDRLLKEFDFKELERRLHYYLEDIQFDNNEYLYLRKAYYLYRIGRCLESYMILKKISIQCYSNKKYLLWYIAIFNMKYLSGKLIHEQYTTGRNFELNFKKALDEIEKINLEEEVKKLPQNIQKKIKYISELISIDLFNQKIQEIQEIITEIKKDKSLLESGGDSYNENIYKLYYKIQTLNNFIQKNYLTIAHIKNISKIFSIFSEGIIVNYSVKGNSNKWFGDSPKVDKFDDFDIEMMLNYTTNKELKSFIEENGINKLNVNKESIYYLLTIFENLTKFNKIDIKNLSNIIDNMLTLLSYSDISKQKFESIMNYCITLLKMNVLTIENLENLNIFIVMIYKNDKELVELNSLILFLKEYINRYNSKELNIFSFDAVKNLLFLNICYICNEKEVSLDSENEIRNFINTYLKDIKAKTHEKDYKIEYIIANFLIPLLSIIEEENIKTNILDSIKELIQYFKILKRPEVYLKIEYYVLLRDILEIEYEEKKQFIINLNQHFNERLEYEKKGGFSSNDYSKMYANMLMSLILEKKIEYDSVKDICSDIKNENNMFSFFAEPDSFDYNNFESDWLMEISDNSIKELAKNKTIVSKIISVLLKKLDENNINKDLKRKILIIIKEILLEKEE